MGGTTFGYEVSGIEGDTVFLCDCWVPVVLHLIYRRWDQVKV